MRHDIKIHREFLTDVATGRKNFEVRINDRNYHAGDTVIMREFDPVKSEYTGRVIEIKITYVLTNYPKIEAGYCVFGFTLLTDIYHAKK